MKSKIVILFLVLCALPMRAWDWWPLPMDRPDTRTEELMYVGGVQALSSSGKSAPTWLQANRNGIISGLPHSGNIYLGLAKPATKPNRWYDYDGAVVIGGRVAGTKNAIQGTGFFEQLYAHVRLYIVDITAGIKPMHFCLGDEELSSGSLLFSTNTHPIPRISIGIDRWTAFPGLYGYLEVKGGLTHGWLDDQNTWVKGTMLHHKYIGGRVGGNLPLNISYEFHHAAQWGGYNETEGDLGNDLRAFKRVFFAQGGGSSMNEILNAQGNHLLSQSLCVTGKGNGWHVDVYWQDIQEDANPRFIGTGQNAKDGLWGIRAEQSRWPFISGVSFEVLQTTDQSGPWHDRDGMAFGGNDNYYWNIVYQQGWTYYGRTIGSPLMRIDNNRVWAYHVGLKGDIYGFEYRALCTYADNYGTYFVPQRSHNTAVLLEVTKTVPQAWGLEFGIALAGDFGTQYGNQFGGMISVRKQGIIKNW